MKTGSSERNGRLPWQSSTFWGSCFKARLDKTLQYESMVWNGKMRGRSSQVPNLYLTPNIISSSWDRWRCDQTNLQHIRTVWKWCISTFNSVQVHHSKLSETSCWLLPHAGFLFGVFLCNAVWHVGGDGAHLSCSLYMKHLIVKVDVRPDLLQHGALRCSGEEQGLVDLQSPGPECLQRPDPRAGCATSCDQVCSDGAVQALAFSVELFLELPQCLQEALQRTLPERKTEYDKAELGRQCLFSPRNIIDIASLCHICIWMLYLLISVPAQLKANFTNCCLSDRTTHQLTVWIPIPFESIYYILHNVFIE